MSRLRMPTCQACMQPHWSRHFISQMIGSTDYNVVDFDMVVHRHSRTVNGKRQLLPVETMMIVELKTGPTEKSGSGQNNTVSSFASWINSACNDCPGPVNLPVRRRMFRYDRVLDFLGVHVLRAPSYRESSDPWYWDGKPVSIDLLSDLLNMLVCPHDLTTRLD